MRCDAMSPVTVEARELTDSRIGGSPGWIRLTIMWKLVGKRMLLLVYVYKKGLHTKNDDSVQ